MQHRPAGEPAPAEAPDGYLRLTRTWHSGDRVELDLPMPARLVTAHPHVDAVRGAAALVRGPVVYCLEQADLPAGGPLAGAVLEDLELDPAAPPTVAPSDGGLTPVALHVPVRVRADTSPAPLYRDVTGPPRPAAATATVTAIPYFLWANRAPGAMRVWIPLAAPEA